MQQELKGKNKLRLLSKRQNLCKRWRKQVQQLDNKKLLQALQNLELELMDKLQDVRQKIKELKEVQNDK